MGAYRDQVNTDGVYIHYEFSNNYADSEGVATTTGTDYGGSTGPTFGTSEVKGTTAATGMIDFTAADRGKYIGTAAQAQTCFGTALDDNNQLSIECWVKFDAGIRSSGVNNIIRSDNGWWFRLNNAHPQMNIRKSTAFDTSWQDTGSALTSGVLYHLVGTWDGTNIRIYINGTLSSTSGSLAGTMNNSVSNNATYIGSPGAETMEATLDELALYRSVLTPTQVANHYAIGTGAATVNATVTDIDVDGIDATVDIITTVNAEVTDVDVAGQPATIETTANPTVNAEVTDVQIDGKDPAGVGGEINVTAEVTNVAVGGQPATVVIPAEVTAEVTNIEVSSPQIDIYDAVVASHAPLHWYKFSDLDQGGSQPSIIDSGSSPDDLEVLNGGAELNLEEPGIPGSSGTSVKIESAGSSLGITFPTGANFTYEFWIKTASLHGSILVGDSNNSTVSNPPLPDRTIYNTNALAVWDGYLARVDVSDFQYSQKTNRYIADNVWHHVVLTKKTVASTVTWKTYVDGVAAATPLNVDVLSQRTRKRVFAGETDGGLFNQFSYTSPFQGYFDEFAIYNYALSSAEVDQHFQAGTYLPEDTEVEADVTNVDVAGGTVSYDTQVNAEVTDIQVRSLYPTIQIPGSVTVGTNFTDVEIDAKDATITIVGDNTQVTIPTNISIAATDTTVRTLEDSFKYVPADDTSLTATDADELISINLGALLFHQNKYQAFKMGNVGNRPINLTISIESSNADLVELVQLSTDKITYSDSVVLSSLQPNSVSDPVWLRLNASDAARGTGSFLINVEQSNA